MDARDYLRRADLADTCPVEEVRDCQRRLWEVMEDARLRSLPAIPSALDRLYTYRVPALSADGSCSLPGVLEAAPYDLGVALGRNPRITAVLLTLDSLTDFVGKELEVGWLGIYQARSQPPGRALVKLAYQGAPSRAEFPLTEDFAARSTNVTVALSGKARCLEDVDAHRRAGGAYYVCDPAVRSEACLPLLDQRGVVGVLDAEHSSASFFTSKRLAWLVALALDLPPLLPPGGETLASR